MNECNNQQTQYVKAKREHNLVCSLLDYLSEPTGLDTLDYMNVYGKFSRQYEDIFNATQLSLNGHYVIPNDKLVLLKAKYDDINFFIHRHL